METQPEVRHNTDKRYERMKTAVYILSSLVVLLLFFCIIIARDGMHLENQLKNIKARYPNLMIELPNPI